MMTVGGLRGVPVRIHWHHTLSSQIKADANIGGLKLLLLRLRARIPYRFVTHAVANSAAARQDLIDNFSVPVKKCHVFWNCLADPLGNAGVAAAAIAHRRIPGDSSALDGLLSPKGRIFF